MLPRTKLQKRVVALSATLPEVTQAQKNWAEQKAIDKYFVRSRKTNYCLECGSKWKPDVSVLHDDVIGCTCPDCNQELKPIKDWKVSAREYEYWGDIIAVKEFQVLRVHRVIKYMKKNIPAEYTHQEVMQHWVAPDGKVTTMSANCQSMGYYYDAFCYGSELEVKNMFGSYKAMDRFRINPYLIWKNPGIKKTVRRNGFYGEYFGHAPHIVFSVLLGNSKAETLLKADQTSLFDEYCKNGDYKGHDRIDKYWKSICIAMRNDYRVTDASSYLDYLGQLETLNMDLRNPKFLCPSNFQAEHRRLSQKIRKLRNAEAEAKRIEKMLKDSEAFERIKKKYFDIEIPVSVPGMKIVVLKSPQEFINEGDDLKHCVASYYNRENSLVLSARLDGKPVESIEVNLNTMKVVQARGRGNKASNYHNEILEAMDSNMHLIARRTKKVA